MTTSHDFEYHNKTIYGITNDASLYAWAGYFLFVIISSLVGDTTILIASLKYKAIKLHKVIVVIIQHIAFCDLMVTVISVLPRTMSIISNGSALGDSLCFPRTFVGYSLAGAGLLLICNMTTSKLLLIKYPLKLASTSQKKAHMFCAACWLAALITPVICLFVAVQGGGDTHFSYRLYTCDFVQTSDIWSWLRPLLAVFFLLIPNTLVVGTTIYLLIIAKQVARRGRESLKWQGIMTTVLTATVYCISILPYAVYHVGESIVTVDDKSSSLFHTAYFRVAVSFTYLNTISNFYIYSLSVHSFRDFVWSRLKQIYRMLTSVGTPANLGTYDIIALVYKYWNF